MKISFRAMMIYSVGSETFLSINEAVARARKTHKNKIDIYLSIEDCYEELVDTLDLQ